MRISASVKNSYHQHTVQVTTNSSTKSISIPAKPEGQGSSVNGGELLFLALATCFCNDVYREAVHRKMTIDSVEVFVSGDFGGEGEPASGIAYHAMIVSPSHTQREIDELITYVDTVAEIHNTLRQGVRVSLQGADNR